MLEELIEEALKIRAALHNAKAKHFSGMIILDLENRLDAAEGSIGAFVLEHATMFISLERSRMRTSLFDEYEE